MQPNINFIIYKNIAPEGNTSSQSSKKKKQVSYRRWTRQQNFTYANFLKDNLSTFQTELDRRKTKVFLRMSELLPGKDEHKCRSHHQKMIKFCGNIEKVIEKFLNILPQLQERNPKICSHSQGHIQQRVQQTNVEIKDIKIELTQDSSEESIFNVLNLKEGKLMGPTIQSYFF